MQSERHLLSRYGKPARELLVDMINYANGRSLDHREFIFGKPETIGSQGYTSVEMSFRNTSGMAPNQKQTIHYYRIDLQEVIGLDPLVIHCEFLSVKSILDAIFDQYGLFIEPEHIQIVFEEMDLEEIILKTRLEGLHFENDAEELSVREEICLKTISKHPRRRRRHHEPKRVDHAYNFHIVFTDDHLVFTGSISVMLRPSLKVLSTNINSLLDLRSFYTQGDGLRPPVEIYIQRGELTTFDVDVASMLRKIPAGQKLLEADGLVEFLSKETGDAWCYVSKLADFNLYNAQVVRNGPVEVNDETHQRWSHMIALELADDCKNLSGILRIYYQAPKPKVPLNRPYNQASVPPLF